MSGLLAECSCRAGAIADCGGFRVRAGQQWRLDPASNRNGQQSRNGPDQNSLGGRGGSLQIGALPVGAYDTKAEAASFQQEVKTDLVLTGGQEAVLNFSLAVGALAEAVTVMRARPLL